MIVTYIRSSSYNNFDYCEMQYFITYVLGYRSLSGKKAQLGTTVHKVLEVLASCTKELQEKPNGKRLSVEDDAIGKVNFTPSKLKTKKFVMDILNRSYLHYTTTCEAKHKYTGSDFKFCQVQTLKALDFNDGQFDPRKRIIVDTEPQFDITIEEPWAKFEYEDPKTGKVMNGQLAIKGTIDLVTEVDSDTIEVVDWKTGQRKNWATGEKKTYDKLLEDPQLLLYNYAISKLYPDYKQAIITIFYTRDGGPFSLCFDKSDQVKFLDMLKQRFNQIKSCKTPAPCSPSRKSFKCTKLCDFYKKKWKDTNMSMCDYVQMNVVQLGHDKTVKDLTAKGHNVGYYEAPG
jgi:hypothetical protein